MNLMFKKIVSIYKEIKSLSQVVLHPGSWYIYDKKTHLHHNLCYSQEGEDMILARFFHGKNKGFYIDVGAHHPQRFSNTQYFYLQGWNGINIDSMPGSMNIFKNLRPNDINLELAVSMYKEVLNYYYFNEPALNGFCKEISLERDGLHQFKIIGEKQIQTHTLSEILDEYLPLNQKIDFINIDVEGLDYQVLSSNNWNKYRPVLVLVEDLDKISMDDANQSEIALFMAQQNYKLYCKTVNTLIFKDLQCPDLKPLQGYEG